MYNHFERNVRELRESNQILDPTPGWEVNECLVWVEYYIKDNLKQLLISNKLFDSQVDSDSLYSARVAQ